jgi:osmotically-inducible protein OsmY
MAAPSSIPMRTDGSLRDSVISELKWDPMIPTANDIALRVKDGVVTLTGFVH